MNIKKAHASDAAVQPTKTCHTIRGRRESLGLTQVDLARLSGLSLSMVAQLERGAFPVSQRARSLPRIEATLDRLAAEVRRG